MSSQTEICGLTHLSLAAAECTANQLLVNWTKADFRVGRCLNLLSVFFLQKPHPPAIQEVWKYASCLTFVHSGPRINPWEAFLRHPGTPCPQPRIEVSCRVALTLPLRAKCFLIPWLSGLPWGLRIIILLTDTPTSRTAPGRPRAGQEIVGTSFQHFLEAAVAPSSRSLGGRRSPVVMRSARRAFSVSSSRQEAIGFGMLN